MPILVNGDLAPSQLIQDESKRMRHMGEGSYGDDLNGRLRLREAAELYTVPSRFTSGSPSVYSDALNEYLEGNGFSACSVVTTPPCSD